MPRQARLDVPGVLQHVIARGIERTDIFRDDDDRQRFVTRFSTLLTETNTECFAWALVPNHFHLLLRPTQIPLSSFMRRLMTGYAVTFNLRHGRSGHVFQNRYKSIVCEEEEYLLALVRYIGLNPLRARLVSNLEAIRQIRVMPDGERALCGEPKIDYSTLPDIVYNPAFDDEGNYVRDRAELTALIGVIIGAIKELDGKVG